MDKMRSGRNPDAALVLMAPKVLAHQVTSEADETVERTPQSYADHARGFVKTYSEYHFTVTEMIAEGDRVYVRWRQEGHHLGSIDGEKPTGKPLIEVSSAVYRVQDGQIAEYWIQIDRKGLELQLARNAK